MPTPHSAPWLKRVLIPFWVVQLVLMLFVFIIFIMLVVAAPELFTVSEVLILILCASCVVLDVAEIILFARRRLKPHAYLIFQVVKTTIWFALFMNAIARGIMSQEGRPQVNTTNTYGVIIFGILFFAFLGSLIYSNVIFHRHRRNKRHRVTGTAITPNPYYNGPFSETGMGSYQPVDGISTHEQPVNSAYPFTPAGTETLAYSGDGVISPLLKKDGPAQGQYVGELPAVDRKGGAKESAMELSAAPEVYELSDTRGNREREDAW